jgi:heme-degrading monooxygenase HmoA
VLELVTSLRYPDRYFPVMPVARVGFFDEPPALQEDDERRRRSLHALLRATPGFIAGYELRDEQSGRLMHISLWKSEAALEAGEQAVRERPVSDQRGISPSRVERWLVDRSF